MQFIDRPTSVEFLSLFVTMANWQCMEIKTLALLCGVLIGSMALYTSYCEPKLLPFSRVQTGSFLISSTLSATKQPPDSASSVIVAARENTGKVNTVDVLTLNGDNTDTLDTNTVSKVKAGKQSDMIRNDTLMVTNKATKAELYLHSQFTGNASILTHVSTVDANNTSAGDTNTVPEVNVGKQPDIITNVRLMTVNNVSGAKASLHSDSSVENCTAKRFLVYRCRQIYCGGLGDRQRGIVFTYLLSVLTGRVFVIDMSYPCLLENFMDVNRYDWLKCKAHLSTFSGEQFKQYTLLDNVGVSFAAALDGTVTDSWKQFNVVSITINGYFVDAIRKHKDAKEKVPWIMKLSTQQVIHEVLDRLFKPKQHILNEINRFFEEQVQGRRFICSHIRIGRNPSNPLDVGSFTNNVTRVLEFLDSYKDVSKYAVLVSTDSLSVREQARKRFPNFVHPNTSIAHIDRTPGNINKCTGMLHAILDQTLLTKCDTLVLTRGNFGSIAVYLRGYAGDVYVYDEEHTNSIVKANSIEDIGRLIPYL